MLVQHIFLRFILNQFKKIYNFHFWDKNITHKFDKYVNPYLILTLNMNLYYFFSHSNKHVFYTCKITTVMHANYKRSSVSIHSCNHSSPIMGRFCVHNFLMMYNVISDYKDFQFLMLQVKHVKAQIEFLFYNYDTQRKLALQLSIILS